MNETILIIGHPKSGKTTFLAQFFTRIKKRKSKIILSKIPENIKAITDAVKRLATGEEPITTSADENVELVLPVSINGNVIDLICPDYGGEQINDLTELMQLGYNWENLVNNSDRWILFIRPEDIHPEYDLSISCYEKIEGGKSETHSLPGLSAQSKFIELLQCLLYAKNKSVKNPLSVPKLSVVLSCWDELTKKDIPFRVLKEKLPLFFNFLETLWKEETFEVFGLSAQEFPLKTSEAKERYINDLPENFGYIIKQDGTEDKDITKLIEMAI